MMKKVKKIKKSISNNIHIMFNKIYYLLFIISDIETSTNPPKRKYTRKSKNSEISNNNDKPSKRTRSKKSDKQNKSNESFDNINQQQTSGRKKVGTIKDLATKFLENESEIDEM